MNSRAVSCQRAYLAFRPIFERENGIISKRHLKRFLNRERSLQDLRTELGYVNLLRILWKLVRDGIFGSQLPAREASPNPTENKSQRTYVPEQFAIDGYEDSDIMSVATCSRCSGYSRAIATAPGKYSRITLKEKAERRFLGAAAAVSPIPDQLQPTHNTQAFPKARFPFDTQEIIFKKTQRILEEVCFEFARKWLLDVLKEGGWRYAAAVELSRWPRILLKNRHRLGQGAPILADDRLFPLLPSIRYIRNLVVHKELISAAEVAHFVGDAVSVANTLQDYGREALLQAIHDEITAKMGDIETQRTVLKDRVDVELAEIRQPREELDRKEREIYYGEAVDGRFGQ